VPPPDPLVTVVVPAFEAGGFLAASLASVLAQDWRPLEALVVDDGSTDGTAAVADAIAGQAPEVRLVRRPRNGGAAAARNAALALARGDLVTFLDADDRMTPGRLAFQVRFLAEHPDADVVVGAQAVEVDPGVEPPGWMRLPPERRPRHYPMSMMARRAAFDTVGPFDAALRVGSDADWLFRASAAGVRIALVDRVLVHRRLHGRNLTYRSEDLRRALLGSLRRRIARPGRAGAP
jgi:glycosyltransferase involved in cell wall biosynthesis